MCWVHGYCQPCFLLSVKRTITWFHKTAESLSGLSSLHSDEFVWNVKTKPYKDLYWLEWFTIQGNYCTYRNLTETPQVWCTSSHWSDANFFSGGLSPRFGIYCTYTTNELLAKKLLICWPLVTKSASIPHCKIARENCLNLQESDREH